MLTEELDGSRTRCGLRRAPGATAHFKVRPVRQGVGQLTWGLSWANIPLGLSAAAAPCTSRRPAWPHERSQSGGSGSLLVGKHSVRTPPAS
jgi:hypothetical protein